MMLRRTFFQSLAAGLAAAAQTPRKKPNFILILADDMGWHDLATYGNPYVKTPNLDRLAREGARFSQASAACPVCSPTRASILTGKYPVRTGVTDWIPGRPSSPLGPIVTPRTAMELKLDEITIAESLKPLGYKSAAIGKWHLGGTGFSPTDQGFDLNVGGTSAGSPPPSGKPYFGPYDLPNIKGGPEDFLTEGLTRAAVRFIGENKDNPFFLYLAHYGVHLPLGARPADIERHKNADGRYDPTYAAMIESLDESAGAVLKALDDNGLAENTMVIFFSDNGGVIHEGQQKRRITDNAPLRAGKGHVYEGGIREPLIVRFPGIVQPGRLIDTPVMSIDFLPTFRDAAGMAPAQVDGASWMPMLRGGELTARPLFWHYPHYSNQGGEPASVIRQGDWKLIEFHADGRRELFNLRDDFGEQKNLVLREPERVRQMTARLDAWRKETGAVMPTKNAAADPAWTGFHLAGEEKPTPPQPR